MIVIRHRVNTARELLATPPELGVEIDLREAGADIVVQHDPFAGGERFVDWLAHYRHRFLILNVKSEGVEEPAVRLAAERGIDEFFVLDASVPAMVKLARRGERRLAVRFSEVEPVEAVLAARDVATWVWVDCFSDYPPRPRAWATVLAHYRACLVSPELQGREAPTPEAAAAVAARFGAAAVCTKQPDRWR